MTKGQASPLMQGRPDLAAYFEMCSTLTNFQILRQGGVTRRPGTRYIADVKTDANDTILMPFEISVNAAYIVEVGNLYTRFYKTKAPILTSAGGVPVEVVTPYLTADLRLIHYTQSADVLFLFHGSYAQTTLNHVSDTNWTLATTVYSPPPSFEADTDVSGGSITLTPAAITGNNILFTASAPVFQAADVGRQIIFGASAAVITTKGLSAGDPDPVSVVHANILVNFPNTNPIAAGSWLLRLSPQTTLTPSAAHTVNSQITLTAAINAFRAADVGKYITILGGLVQIQVFTSATVIQAILLSDMGDVTGAISAVPAGAWSLQIASWSAVNGYPRTGEFFQGRLAQAGTLAQPTTWWLSSTDAFNIYAIGTFADNATQYTVASRRLDRMEWLGENIDLYLGTSGAILRAQGGNVGQPIGGDVVPLITRLLSDGCAPMQPIIVNRHTLYMDRNLKKFYDMAYSFYTGEQDSTELTAVADGIFGAGAMNGQMAFQKRPDPRIYWAAQDGSLVTLTYYPVEKVVGFTRFLTQGSFQSVAVIPGLVGESDQVWVIVQRTVNGASKRYVEMLEANAAEMAGRAWTSAQTDCASFFNVSAGTTVFSVPQLNGLMADVVANGSYIGQFPVIANNVTLPPNSYTQVEIGLDYVSTGQTMRPALPDQVISGLPRQWNKLWLLLDSTIGGQVQFSYSNPIQIPYAAGPLDTGPALFTGECQPVAAPGEDTDGRVSFIQNQPYPMTVLALYGELQLGSHG